jgi:2-amino-4-hydroxy-6-hydroxymethyldihydropteridine diphosphokinase
LMPPAIRPLAQSPIYETSPWGYTDQPDFLNQVVQAETDLPPEQLLPHLKSIEVALGRAPNFRYGPRLIDLDILFYDDLVLQTPDLIIPHPRLTKRAFVLMPLADLAPDLRHPVLGQTVRQLLAGVDPQGIRRYNPPDQDKGNDKRDKDL